MNKAFLMGRLTKDPEVRYSQGENSMAIARFTVAIDRKGKDAGADFISCVSFGKPADLIEKYFKKGNRICIAGHIQTGSYTNKDGAKVYTTDVVVDELDFVDSKSDAPQSTPDNDVSAWSDVSETLPFA